MNDLGVALIWCAIQVSLLTFFAAVLFLVCRRARIEVGSLAPLVGLLILVVLPLLMFVPVPSWISHSTASDELVAENGARHETSTDRAPETSAVINTKPNEETGGPSLFSMFASAFVDELSTTSSTIDSQNGRLKWTGTVAILFLVGAVMGLAHLVFGLVSMRSYRRRGRAIDALVMIQLLDSLRSELNCRRKVRLQESPDLTTAATVGWLRPMILLPAEWTNWSEQERRTVLAHELAHICRHDYLACVCGQLSLSLHFYHPIVHWLVGQLRLEQELAADNLAASSSGGRKAYLATLAEMALRQTDQRVNWAARAFIPTRTTFMRRIDMLQQEPSAKLTSAGSRVSKFAIVAALMVVAVAVIGLRAPSPAFGQQSRAEEQRKRALEEREKAIQQLRAIESDSPIKTLSLAYVPRDAAIVAAIRPAALLKQPGVKALAAAMQQGGDLKKQMGISIDQIEQVTMVLLVSGSDRMEPDLGGFILRTSGPDGALAFVDKFVPKAKKDKYDGREYLKSESGQHFCYFADNRTVVVCEKEENLRRMMVAGKTGASKAAWADAWKKHATHEAALQYNFSLVRHAINAEVNNRDQGNRTASQTFRSQFAVFSPLWNNADSGTLSLKFDDRLSLQALADCKNAEDAKKVQDTLNAVATLARNGLSMSRAVASKQSGPEGAMALRAADIADGLLDKLKINIRKDDVVAEASVDAEESVKLIAMMIPAVQSARTAARRAQSMNNLKQIGLGFHNHADVNKRFPSSTNGDRKHPHSWRVAILPYIEQKNLYDQYQFDEPWDSESNKKLISKMPVVYRHPNAPADSTYSAYYVLTGESPIFDGKTRFRDITDGTANTILTVEAKREIPWTKPEDIAYDAEKALPKLGGYFEHGFNVGFADGSVRFMMKDINEKVLRAIITASGGEDVRDALRDN